MKRRQDEDLDDVALAAEVAVVQALRDRHPSGAVPVFGVPGPCLRCTDVAMVDRVNAAAGRARHRCVSCGATWTVTQRALDAVSRELERRQAVVGAGVLIDPLLAREPDLDRRAPRLGRVRHLRVV
ncbi:MAG: hypothetical protein R2726_11990 [Acidimicrobiales bacterium]